MIVVLGVIIVHTLAIATHAVGHMVADLIAVTGDLCRSAWQFDLCDDLVDDPA